MRILKKFKRRISFQEELKNPGEMFLESKESEKSQLSRETNDNFFENPKNRKTSNLNNILNFQNKKFAMLKIFINCRKN